MASDHAIPLRGDIASLGPGSTVELRSGEVLRADLLVFAMGWRQPLRFLARELRDEVEEGGVFRLYRHILREAFGRYLPSRYRSVPDERRRARQL